MTSRDGDPWSAAAMVSGFAASAPNASLLHAAGSISTEVTRMRAIDIGCGAGRNAIPLARSGWEVFGIDRAAAMLRSAQQRASSEGLHARLRLAQAQMDHLPAATRQFDLIIAHGIWNLAATTSEFREGLLEAARVAAPGARLFVFTFSRSTLPADARPSAGDPFVYTSFSGRPQTFLTGQELLAELAGAGFLPDPQHPLRELNRPAAHALPTLAPAPVIWEGLFRLDR